MTPEMKSKALVTGLSLLIAGLTMAGLTAAQPLALVTGDGGGSAAGQADAAYNVDATEGIDKAYQTHRDLQTKADSAVSNANTITSEAKWSAYQGVDELEMPQMPQCACEELFGQLEQAGNMEVAHSDEIRKAGNLDTGVVDAGADVGAAAQVQGWFKDATSGAEDAFNQIRGVFGYETHADENVKQVAESGLHAEEQVRGELVNNVDTQQELPRVNPQLSGDLGASHATSLATDAAGSATGGLTGGLS